MSQKGSMETRKDVLKMAVFAEPVKAAFVIEPEKSEKFKKNIDNTKIFEIQEKVKNIKNISMKDFLNEE